MLQLRYIEQYNGISEFLEIKRTIKWFLADCATGCTKCTNAGAVNCDGADYCDTGYCYYATSATSAGKCISKSLMIIMSPKVNISKNVYDCSPSAAQPPASSVMRPPRP